SPNKQMAWEFYRFISDAKDDLEHHQMQGILPVWTVNLDTPYVKSRPDYQSTKDMLAQPVPPTYFHPKSNELATAFGDAVVGVLFGKGQPKPLLDEAAAKMDRILKELPGPPEARGISVRSPCAAVLRFRVHPAARPVDPVFVLQDRAGRS